MTAKILIVDDEKHVRYTLKRILRRDDYEIVTVESGNAALQLIKKQVFDLALVDINLKDMSGMEVLDVLSETHPDTAVIVLTGYASLETSIKSLRQGVHDYLFKPTKAAELRESVRTALVERQKRVKQRNLLSKLGELANSIDSLTDIMSEEETTSSPPSSADPPERFLQCGDLKIDTLSHIITIDEQTLEVSPTEFEVLLYLTQKAPEVVSPIELISQVQGYDSETWEAKHIARQYIYRLRQKIKESTNRDNIIRTVRSHGYTINPRSIHQE